MPIIFAQIMPVLETGKCGEEMERATHEIYYLEKEADELLAETLATLYDGVTDISQLINAMRWGDIFQILEDPTARRILSRRRRLHASRRNRRRRPEWRDCRFVVLKKP